MRFVPLLVGLLALPAMGQGVAGQVVISNGAGGATPSVGIVQTGAGAASSPQVATAITFPLEEAAPPYSTVVQTFSSPYGTRKNQVVTTGWNADQSKATEPVWVMSHESDFCPDAATCLSEWHLAWSSTPSSGVGYRMLSFSANRVDNSSTGYFQTGILGFRGADNLDYESIDTSGTSKKHFLYHGIKFIVDTNNVSPMSQLNAAGNGYVDLFKLNASNEIEFAPAGQNLAWTGGAHGATSTATGTNAFAPGRSSSASGNGATALGVQSDARLYGQVSHAYGGFSANGNNQASRLVVSGRVPAAADVELKIAEAYRVTMQTGVAYAVRVQLVVTDYADRTKVVAFSKAFAATMAGAAATALLNGVTTEIALTEDYGNVATLTAFAKADTTNGAITLWIRPPAGNTNLYLVTGLIEWVEVGW